MFSRSPRLSKLLSAVVLAPASLALFLASGCTCGSGPYQGDYLDGDRPGSMKGVAFVEGDKGDPKVVGCADGQREGFADLAAHPRVAGCVGLWEGSKNLRDKPTGKPCGDDLEGSKCGVPADVCAEGWHVCLHEGKSDDLRDRVEADACENGSGPGRFNAAASHSPNDEIDPCPRINKNTMLPCMLNGLGAEPVCCGGDCKAGKCKDGVWKGKTLISRGTTEGCGSVSSERNGGVLCCFDGDEPPVAAAAEAVDTEAVAAPEGESGAPEGDAKAESDVKADSKTDGKADSKPE